MRNLFVAFDNFGGFGALPDMEVLLQTAAKCWSFAELFDLERQTNLTAARWGAMVKPRSPDNLSVVIALLLPPEPTKPKGGRPRTSDRAALTGILSIHMRKYWDIGFVCRPIVAGRGFSRH